MNYSLSPNEVETIVRYPVRSIISSEFWKYNSILELFGDCDRVLILYQTKDIKRSGKKVGIYGHYTAMLRLGDEIHYFNSYGTLPSKTHYEIPNKYRDNSNQTVNHLKELILKSRYKYHYSPYEIQHRKEGINTCGRHVAMFLKCGMPVEDYYNKFLKPVKQIIGDPNNKYYDEEVLRLTKPIIGK